MHSFSQLLKHHYFEVLVHKSTEKYIGFYDTYSIVFEDFLFSLDALSNARLIHHMLDLPTKDRYLRAISCDL